MVKVSLYLRTSTAHQNTEMQRVELLDYVKARGWDLAAIHDEIGSGTHDRRPELNKLLESARNREIDVIIVFKLDRLFRSLRHMVGTLHELSELGVEFVSVRDNIDLTTASGRLMIHLLSAFSEFEAAIIKERVIAGLQNARRKGVVLGRKRTRDESAILSLRKDGLSIRQICKRLGCSIGSVQRTIAVSKTHQKSV